MACAACAVARVIRPRMGSNLFTRRIPPSLRRLKGIRMLNLTSKRLSSAIPPELGKITGLQVLDHSRNDLSGGVPTGLGNMTSLIELDVSGNNLAGNVPLRGVFANATGFKMAGNGALCGGAPHLWLPPCEAPTDSTRSSYMFLKIAMPIIGATLCIAVVFTIILRWRCRRKKPTTTSMAARNVLNGNYYPRVSYAELAKATDGFAEANLIGVGKYGSVYRGTLSLKPKGNLAHDAVAVAVAVKVLDLRQAGACKTFLSECQTLQSARHRNLIDIVTCCASIDPAGGEFRALVFDLMPNSSLDRWLHPGPSDVRKHGGLSLVQRLGIAVDIAEALSYLHNSCDPPIVHCDLKPSNILLGDDMTACIGNFGLAKLLLLDAPGGTESTIGIRGTIGYVAPEYGTTGIVSTAGDVYSYGVTLLEILAGKAPTDSGFEDGMTLLEFFAAAFPERIERVLDPAMLPVDELDGSVSVSISTMPTVLPPYSEENEVGITARDCVVSAVRVGLSCCRPAPYERMGMKEVAAEMRRIRDAWLRAGSATSPVA